MNRGRGAAIVAAVCLAIGSGWVTPACAQTSSITQAQLRTLAANAAGGDDVALAELRSVTAVDGRPAGLGLVLGSADGSRLRARLLALSLAGPSLAVSADGARRTAAAILGATRYGKATVPDPILSALRQLGRWIASAAAGAPGGPVAFWAVAAVLVLALAATGARRMLHRLEPRAQADLRATAPGEDPSALEQEAQAAEARGAFEHAVRLRFRAGLLRLGSRAAIEYRPSLLTAEVASRLHSPQFDSLAESFERIAYGGAGARSDDADAAREGWRSVLSHAERGR